MSATKTAIGIESTRGYLRLRLPQFVAKGSRRYISTGLQDTQQNRRKAQAIAWEIEDDLSNGNFDWTFRRYRFSKHGYQNWEWNLNILWIAYCEFMKPQLAPTTYEKDYIRKYANHIKNFPSHDIRDALKVRDFLLNKFSVGTAKKLLIHINACCNWAMDSKLIPINPYEGLGRGIKKPRKTQGDIEVFTKHERDLILEQMSKHAYHQHYIPFVKFLFLTGCRIGEAIALQWGHVASDFSYIQIQQSYDSKTSIRKGTKTGAPRKYPCNAQLKNLLISIRPKRRRADTPVFQAPEGGVIHSGNFTRRVWKGCTASNKEYQGVLGSLIKEGKINNYRSPQVIRHTTATWLLESGLTVAQVANLLGNSPQVLLKHYTSGHIDTIPDF